MESEWKRIVGVWIAVMVCMMSLVILPGSAKATTTKVFLDQITYEAESHGNTVYMIIDVYKLIIDGKKYIVLGAKDYLTPNKDHGWDIFGDGLWYTWPYGENSAWILFKNPKSGGYSTSFTAFSPDCHIKKDPRATITWGLSGTAGYASDNGPQASGTAWVTWTTTIFNEEMWPSAMQQHKGEFIGKINGAHNQAHVFFGGVTQRVTHTGKQTVDYQIGGYFSHNNWWSWTKLKLWIYGTIYEYVW